MTISLALSESADHRLRGTREADASHQLPCHFVAPPPVHEETSPTVLPAHKDVLRHGQIGQEVQFLEDDADAHGLGDVRRRYLDLPSVEEDAALILGVDTGKDLDQGRLAGPVLSHQGHDFPSFDLEVDAVQSYYARETFGDALHQQKLRHGFNPHLL